MNGGDNSERGDRGDKSRSGAEAVQKRRRDKDGLCTGLLGSAREHDWVVGLQILTNLTFVPQLIFDRDPCTASCTDSGFSYISFGSFSWSTTVVDMKSAIDPVSNNA